MNIRHNTGINSGIQTAKSQNNEADLAKSVLVNGLSSSGTADEWSSLTRALMWRLRYGMSVLWRCCDSWRSTQRPCTRFCVEWATNADHAVMARHETVLELGEQSSLHCFALCTSPHYRVSDCIEWLQMLELASGYRNVSTDTTSNCV